MTKYVYFASDFHLGLNTPLPSIEREKTIVAWLDSILETTEALYILGDLFDYWFEYGKVIPKGHVRTLAKIAEFTDRNIPVYLFTGNHDLWMFGYLEEELGLTMYTQPIQKTIGEKKFFLGHGDGLGPGDHGYKFMKKIFSNKLCQWLFARVHPNLGIRIMKHFSKKSRESRSDDLSFRGPDNEWLLQFSERKLESEFFDYFIFGHRHLPIDYKLKNGVSRYINTGDWVIYNSYARFDGKELELLNYVK